ncbi:hypothetical protein QR680_017632 [Steinernema hermaphroditum]|uniref:Major sperm protein n=1 Tax=Steinernema hermaphroditum TaxID=289476 RepID=A0AA39HFA7_9BILA|nr:hypothetical protein QR680_017632 [Steinernema hermaphroditum]
MAFPLSSDPAVNGSEAIPPFLNAGHKPVSSPSANKELQFITVDSVVLRFDASEAPSSKRELTLTNTSQHRVAWRLRTNAPTRYVVSPANGFLTPTESVVVVVDLADVAKYHKRHRFMVQAMEAKEEEKDHKKIWNSDRASKLAFLQCVRVFTEGSESNTIAGNGLISPVNNSTNPGSTAESSVYTSSTSSGSRFTSSGSTITTSSSSDASSDTSSCSTTSGVSSTSEASAEYNERINDVTQKIRKAMEKKEGVSQNMIKVVNEVKKIEVELDHAGAVCQDLNARLTSIQDQTKGLEQRSAEIEKQLKPMKEGK